LGLSESWFRRRIMADEWAGVSDLFKSLNESRDDIFNVLLYGNSKSGKTRLIGTLGSRTLIISLDPNGTETLKSKEFQTLFPCNPIIVSIEEAYGYFSLPEIATGFDKVYDALEYAFKIRTNDFDHVCLDSLTSLSKLAMFKALDVNMATGRSKSKLKLAEQNAILMGIQDYGMEINLVTQTIDLLLSNCRRFGKNLIVTAHERLFFEKPRHGDGKIDSSKPEELKSIRPMVTGKVAPDTITSPFSNVWYTKHHGGDSYRLHLKGDGVYIAGSRHAGLWPSVLPDPLEKDKERAAKFKHGANLAVMIEDVERARKLHNPTEVAS
jgi:hypothetical protein